ncbi:MAG: 3-oxoacyl-ACP synthase [Bacteroidia bacterium]
MTDLLKIKELLYLQCANYVSQRLKIVQTAIDSAGEAGNDETKSSAGDKHETGRAMMQLEQEKNGKQLKEVLELQKLFEKIIPSKKSTKAELGALVITDKQFFYISISAGKIVVNNQTYWALSPQAPLANKLIGLSEGEKMEFNGNTYNIKQIL